jgi:hypothetical protein
MKLVSLSPLRTCRLYPSPTPGNISGTRFCWRLIRPQGHIAAGRVISVTQSGIGPATFRLVAQYLEQLRHVVPRIDSSTIGNISHYSLAASCVTQEVFALETESIKDK